MRLNLIQQIFIWILIPITCVVCFVYFQFSFLHRQLTENLNSNLETTLNRVERELQLRLETTTQLAESIIRNADIVNAYRNRETDFLYQWGNRMVASKLLDSVTFADAERIVLAKGHDEYGFNQPITDTTLFLEGVGGKTFSGIARFEGKLALVSVRPIVEYQTIIRGVIIVAKDIDPNIRGQLEEGFGITLDFTSDPTKNNLLSPNGRQGILQTDKPLELATPNNLPLSIIIQKDYSSEYQQYQAVKSTFFLFTALATCAALLIVYLSVSRLLAPLRTLHQWLTRYQQDHADADELHTHINELRTKNNELGIIAYTAFATLDELEATRTRLVASNKEAMEARKEVLQANKQLQIFSQNLELQVAKRTEQLNLEIQDRKQAEQESRNLKNRLQAIFDAMPSILVGLNSQRLVTHWNKQAVRYSGWESAQAIGSHFNRAVSQLGFDEQIDTADLNSRTNMRRQLISDNCASYFDITCFSFQDDQDQGMVVRIDDVTRDVMMEQELLKAEKIKSIGVLAGGIAHDFNNLLTAILGNISLLKTRAHADPQTVNLLENAEKASIRAKSLTNQLLTFSKGGNPVKQSTSLAGTVRDAALIALTGKHVHCSIDIPDDLWSAHADKDQIGQVVQNIVLNAGQAANDDGNITVSCANIRVPEEYQATGLQPGPYVRIAITDDGPGIAASALRHVFDPYYTTKKEGNGLGLAICHSIISKHNGTIDVQSQTGSGTTFAIFIPALMNEHPPANPSSSEERQVKSKKILVMDDEPLIREMAGQMLIQLGHSVLFASSGEEAVQTYQEALDANEPIDLTIMDIIVHGGMGGKDAVSKVLAIDPKAKVIVSSGYSNDPVMSQYDRYGFAQAIAKPYSMKELSRVLREVLT